MQKQRFILVPDQSMLNLETSGPETGFRIVAELRTGARKVMSWDHSELTARRRTRTLKATDEVYTLLVNVLFTSKNQAAVALKMTIKKPDDSIHSKTKKFEFAGSRPAKDSGTTQILMQ